MNILLASDSNVERAGVCLFMLGWIQGIKEINSDYHVSVYFRKSVKDLSFEKRYRESGAELFYGNLPEKQTSLSSKNRNKVRSDIRKILDETKYDIIHINSSAAGFAHIVLTEAVRAGVPCRVLHSHGRNNNNIIKKIYLFGIKKRNRHLATKCAACSLNAGEYLFGKTITRSKKWNFIPNTIDCDQFAYDEVRRQQRRKKLGIAEDELLIGATGMLIKLKNHVFLLETIRSLLDNGVSSFLAILGEGEERESLERKAVEIGIQDRIIMPGVVENVAEWLSAFDFYTMPSFSEGLPLGAVEAQANGLCCFLSDQIPEDVVLCQDVFRLPIDQGADIWVKAIQKQKRKNREERLQGKERVSSAGFDRKYITKYISQLYGLE